MKGKQPVDIGARRELFVDRHIVGALKGAAMRLHHPQKMPLAEHPLKDCHYMTIIKEGALFRAYYRSTIPSYNGKVFDGCPRESTCYAESSDGHEWSFPELGLIEINGSRKNNVILS